MKNWKLLALLVAFGTLAVPGASQAADMDLTAVVDMLREEGVINDAQYQSMYEKAAKKEQAGSWSDRISLSGDMRQRVETFQYDRNALDAGRRDRTRARYRARLNIKAKVNDNISAIVRIASGEGTNTSTNTSFGRSLDWGPDAIFFDRAYLQWNPHADGSLLGGTGKLAVEVGRVPNPFQQKGIGFENLLFDSDVNLTGGSAKSVIEIGEMTDLMLNAGYYIVDEEGGAQDPALFAIQGGSTIQVSDDLAIGGRASFYNFVNLNNAFFARGVAVGNLVNGLSDDTGISVLSGKVFANFEGVENWPIQVYAQVSSNLSAERVIGSKGRDDLAWLVGVQTGDKKKFLQLDAFYGQVEANAFPAQFTDSDWFDGQTNRKGFAISGTRQIYPNTDLKLTVFNGKEMQNALAYRPELAGSRRSRIQADVVVKF